ncbi:MAG: hypothetical protein ACJ8GV_16375 [Luteimonas sp.]
MRHPTLLIGSLLAGAIAASASARDAAEVVAFPTTVKVVVDERGQPTDIEASPKLSQGLRDFVEARARDLAFEPAVIDGRPRGGVTYVVFGVCAVPAADEQMQLAAEYRSHGPGLANGSAYPAPPRYPVEAARRGLSANMTVHYIVQPDGSASLDSVEFAEGTRDRSRAPFERMAREWVGGMQALPEQVDGQAITTRVSIPVTLEVANAGSRKAREMLKNMQDSRTGSAECLAAEQTQPGGQIVTAQSAFVIRDAG